jgi:hypothetical protein
MELFFNASFYATHPLFRSVFASHPDLFQSVEAIFEFSVSNSAFNTSYSSSSELVKAEAVNNCCSRIWSSFLCILALSSVIKCKIETILTLV